MINITVTLRQDYKKKDNIYPIYLSFQLDRKKIRLNSGVTATPEEWDDDKKVIKGRSKDANDKNLVIKAGKAFITDIHVRYRLKRATLTEEKFLREWENRAASKDFIKYFEKRCNEKLKQNDIAESTWMTQKRLVKDLFEFRGVIPFYDLSESLLKDFRSFLRSRKNGANTINKKFRILHTYINDAIKDKLIDSNAVDDVEAKTEDVDVLYLNDEELNTLFILYRANTLSDLHQQVLRKFLFSCLCGLRISDANAIEMYNLVSGYIQKLMFKTRRTSGRITRIPLTVTLQELVRDANPEGMPGKIFGDGITEQAINRNLKEIAKIAEIDKRISFKTARHTFGYLYYKRTKDLLSLQSLLGHSKIQQTLIYAHLNDEDILEGMSKFDIYSSL